MRYCESGPRADQTDEDDGPETNVLTCDDSSGRNPSGKQESKKKSVINICGYEGGNASGQHRQILIHDSSDLSVVRTLPIE